MRKEFFVDRVQIESMSKILPHVVCSFINGNFVIKKSEKPINPYKGVPSSAFSLASVVASGGSLVPSPSVVGSRMESRDSLDSNLGAFKANNERVVAQKKFEDSFNEFQKVLAQ